jgi:hypothetical protein
MEVIMKCENCNVSQVMGLFTAGNERRISSKASDLFYKGKNPMLSGTKCTTIDGFAGDGFVDTWASRIVCGESLAQTSEYYGHALFGCCNLNESELKNNDAFVICDFFTCSCGCEVIRKVRNLKASKERFTNNLFMCDSCGGNLKLTVIDGKPKWVGV